VRCAGIAIVLLLAGGGYWLYTPPSPFVPLSGLEPSAVSMIALGDQGSGNMQQWRVGQAMEQVAAREGRLDMVVLLGDNFTARH
jgi:hypothetical protein